MHSQSEKCVFQLNLHSQNRENTPVILKLNSSTIYQWEILGTDNQIWLKKILDFSEIKSSLLSDFHKVLPDINNVSKLIRLVKYNSEWLTVYLQIRLVYDKTAPLPFTYVH